VIEYDCKEFKRDVVSLSNDIRSFAPQTIIAIARGGLTLAHSLSQSLDIRDVQVISAVSYSHDKQLSTIKITNIPTISTSRILVVDDIADSGRTFKEVMTILKENNPSSEFKTASIFYKKSSIFQPDFRLKEAKEWIEFFWEKF